MSTGPPDKLFGYDLSSYTTGPTRVAVINNFVDQFHATYGVYPSIILLDSVVNTVYLGAYGA